FIGPAPVGSFPPNDFGVYDMLGNAWEWCSDWFALYADEEQVNPTGPAEGKSKIFRGGSWGAGTHKIRCAVRSALPPKEKHTRIGFRVVIRE
ncbi:SUMF1/EgtB/PvdO family nonheme iron enzyme, partial [bacterium]|nr:SUMF1/EgtB/PvdO family nonheme iron enzyme [bacterium]